MSSLAEMLTVIVTTSPAPSNPSTEMLEYVVGSLGLVPGLLACRILVICDGHKRFEEGVHARCASKRGIINDDLAARYALYVERVAELVAKDTRFQTCELVRLSDRHGFGWAVKEGLMLARTPSVFVVQHDYELVATFDALGLCRLLRDDDAVRYVNLLSTSTANYVKLIDGKYDIHLKTRTTDCGISLVPLLFWYDKPHLATRQHYLSLVFGVKMVRGVDGSETYLVDPELASRGKQYVVKKGDFIEGAFICVWLYACVMSLHVIGCIWKASRDLNYFTDTFGGYILHDLKSNGMAVIPNNPAHAPMTTMTPTKIVTLLFTPQEHTSKYATWILDQGSILTCHLHGRRFITTEQREQSGKTGRARRRGLLDAETEIRGADAPS
jgi:hypothetical protein